MIRVLWGQQVKSIIDIKIGNADTDSYKYKPVAELLDWWLLSKRTSTVSNLRTNRNIFIVGSFSIWNSRERSPCRTCTIDLSHVREMGKNIF